jgi:putative ABC transport system permease protein
VNLAISPPKSVLRFTDVLRLATVGPRTRPLRAALSALGVAIGIASIVTVLGISSSAQADLLAQIDRLGTNVLTVSTGHSVDGRPVPLPATALPMIGRIDGVQHTAATGDLPDVHAYRTDLVPVALNSSISVRACSGDLLATLGGALAEGRFLDPGTARYPVVVLGSAAASRLGATTGRGTPDRIWLTGHWFSVLGVLQPMPLSPEIDQSALIGTAAATALYGYDGRLSRVYVQAGIDRVTTVSDALARAANPTEPQTVYASRPSDALTARVAVARSGTGLLLGLGVVALVIGAIGVANVMVISVLERRTEIGLRRALGARARHIGTQFIAESLVLAAAGGILGTLLGCGVTAVVATGHGWTITVPAVAVLGGPLAATIVGVIAGFYPATRAARLAPTDALHLS